jgi:hypothetical protein
MQEATTFGFGPRAQQHIQKIEEATMRTAFVAVVCSALWIAASPALAQQKTVKACTDEWRANRAANQAAGITEKAYVEKCRSGGTAAPATTPAAAPAPAAPPAAAPAKPAAAAPAPAVPATPAPTRASAPAAATGANEFSNEGQAKSHCSGSDIVVWANLNSKIYHFSGHKDYGHTKEGAYMCEKDALGQGIRAAKNEKHP